MALSKAKIDQLGKHLEQGQYANAEDMVTLKELVDYEVNTRRHQNYKITTEVPKQFGQFDTAKFINNLLGGLRVLNKNKFELVIQNWTFIRALYEIWRKIKKLMEYQEYTKYPDNAGCDGECRGLCSSCSSSCVGGSAGTPSSGTGGIIIGNAIYYNRLTGEAFMKGANGSLVHVSDYDLPGTWDHTLGGYTNIPNTIVNPTQGNTNNPNWSSDPADIYQTTNSSSTFVGGGGGHYTE